MSIFAANKLLTIKNSIMEVSTTKIAGCEVYVLFVGTHYYFNSNFYGIIGIAERAGCDNDDDLSTFILSVGNSYTDGGPVNRRSILTAMKRFINRSENKFIPQDIKFIDTGNICNHGLHIEAVEYRIKNDN